MSVSSNKTYHKVFSFFIKPSGAEGWPRQQEAQSKQPSSHSLFQECLLLRQFPEPNEGSSNRVIVVHEEEIVLQIHARFDTDQDPSGVIS